MDKAAKHWLPIYVGVMTSVFSIYLLLKGLKPLLKNPHENQVFLLKLKESININTSVFIGILI